AAAGGPAPPAIPGGSTRAGCAGSAARRGASGCTASRASRRCGSPRYLPDQGERGAFDRRVRALAAEPLLDTEALPGFEGGRELEAADERVGGVAKLGEPAEKLPAEEPHELEVAVAQVGGPWTPERRGPLVARDPLEEERAPGDERTHARHHVAARRPVDQER